jgi:hypothetical protein
MATNNTTNPTLLDVAKRTDPNGKIDTITELLSETNEILLDATAVEGNDGTGHKTTMRTGYPQGTWRKFNFGVQPEKSTTVQVRDTTGMLETYAKVDKGLAELNGNAAAFRLSEDRAFLEGLNQTVADTMFYGDTDVTPEKFNGLAPRFDAKSGVENGDNILLGGGAGSTNTSVWLIGWSPLTCHLIYPKGSKAGLQHRDLGEDTSTDSSGNEYQILRTHYKWDVGLTIRDWRYVVRIANVDVTALTKDAASGADLVDLMVQALELPPSMGNVRWAFYCNRTVRSFLRRQITNKDNVWLSMDEVAGKKTMMFGEVPVRRCDSILNTEATIS